MTKAQAELAFAGTQLIGGRYEPIAVIARMPLAVRITALDLSASDFGTLVLLALPHDALALPQLAAMRERFRRLAHLAHPNIPPYRPGCTNGASWCVSDPLDGETLAEILEQRRPGTLEKDEIDTILQKLASALAAAHELRVSHGALTLEHVIVTPDRDILLTGFDLGDEWGQLEFTPAADLAALDAIAEDLERVPAHSEVPAQPPGPEIPAQPPGQVTPAQPSGPEVPARPPRPESPAQPSGPEIPPQPPRPEIPIPASRQAILRKSSRLAPPVRASRLLPDSPRPRRPRQPPRRPGRFRFAAIAVLVLAVVAIDPSELWRMARTAVDPDGYTVTVPGESTGGPAVLAVLPNAADESAAGPVTSPADALADGSVPLPVDSREAGLAHGRAEAPDSSESAAVVQSNRRLVARSNQAELARTGPRAEPEETLPPGLRFSPASLVTVNEGDGSARLTLRPATGRSTEVIWWPAESSARRDSDYADSGLVSVSISAGSAVDIVVPLVADLIAESDEVFDIYASAVANGKQIGVPVRTSVRIVDDD